MALQWSPSEELSAALSLLSRRQQRAVLRIVNEEMRGIPLTRLLKTPYSCQWCGWVAGHSGERRDDRKAKLAAHEAECERKGTPWRFVCNLTTYYNRWSKDEAFRPALEAARRDMTQQTMAAAVRALQAGTWDAVKEIRRQISEAYKDADRQRAAFGLLDRAGVETAQKATQTHEGQIDFVQVTEDELAAIEEALRREAGSGGEAE